TSARRAGTLPAIPTMMESGFRDYEVDYWYGLFAPRQTPAAVIASLNKHLQDALRSPETASGIRKQGAEPANVSLQKFSAFLVEDAERWQKAVKLSGATAN
ncbi:MAG: tripartite tricarboxylate transporter substrate binding protein, partial [Burkholderiales bacterium]|nr:tripartite tricarboxylate transporter substrate binding protein [Burkholderiales bacterium]